MGNGETKELICMTHGHEPRGRGMLVGGRWRGINGGKWDNFNSIINKIYLKKKKSNPILGHALRLDTTEGYGA